MIKRQEGVERGNLPVDNLLSRNDRRRFLNADNTEKDLLSENESMKVFFSDN